MAIVMRSRVKETTVTQGTGSYTLGGAVTGFRTFLTAFGNGTQVFYVVEDGTNWEVGAGTVSSTGPSLSRDTIYESSNSNAAVNWGAGTRNIYCAYPPSYSGGPGVIFGANNLSDLSSASTARTNLGLGTAATLNVGTSANNIVQLNASAKLPAVDGSLLTNIAPFPSGTAMPFYQAAAPTGWTKVTGINDKLFYVTDGTGANPAGGTNNTGTGGWDNSWGLSVGSHTLTISEIPSHTHDYVATFSSGGGIAALQAVVAQNPLQTQSFTSGSAGSGAGHSHGISSTSQWRPPAAYFIICTKN